jgi:phosphopantetheinyl transferase (holo-ACP synthase)
MTEQLSHISHLKTNMTAERELAQLEHEMARLCQRRAGRIAAAEAMVKAANRDYDEHALVLGRRINLLREQLEAAQSPAPEPVKRHRVKTTGHDSDWCDEDIAHFYELQNRKR